MWAASKDGLFSVSSFFRLFQEMIRLPGNGLKVWKMKAPLRVIAFDWLALERKILTLDNLRKRKIIVVNACPMCLGDEELVEHLLLKCKVD